MSTRFPRIFVDQPLATGQPIALPTAASRHLIQVLRLQPGASVVLFNGDGHDYPSQLIDTDRHQANLRVGSPGEREEDVRLEIELAIGVSRGERMDLALQKSVELGVNRITPLFTAHSQVQLSGARLQRRLEHWLGIIIGACEQCGRRRLPQLAPAEHYQPWLDRHDTGGLLLDPSAAQSLTSLPAPPRSLTLLVGPEGGLSPGERALALARDFQGVRLGPRILRTETAPIAAIAVIQALWGDLRDAPHPGNDLVKGV